MSIWTIILNLGGITLASTALSQYTAAIGKDVKAIKDVNYEFQTNL